MESRVLNYIRFDYFLFLLLFFLSVCFLFVVVVAVFYRVVM